MKIMHRYEQLQQIGRGSYGTVFKCRLKYSGQFVALKVISTYGKSKNDIEQLRKEIQLLQQIKHQNIIQFFESFEEDGNIFISSELAETDLFDILQDGPLPVNEIQKIAYQIIQVLNFLHTNRIAHRDIKPQNVLVCDNGACKLCDFGFAHQLSAQSTALNSIKGSPIYLAPEIAKGISYNVQSDIWSYGVMLFELATQKPPFIASDYIQLLRMLQQDTLQVPYHKYKVFQENPIFLDFVEMCLQRNTDKRWTSQKLLEHPFLNPDSQKFQMMKLLSQQTKKEWMKIINTQYVGTDSHSTQLENSYATEDYNYWSTLNIKTIQCNILIQLLKGDTSAFNSLFEFIKDEKIQKEHQIINDTQDLQQMIDFTVLICQRFDLDKLIISELVKLSKNEQNDRQVLILLLRLLALHVGCAVQGELPETFGNDLEFPFDAHYYHTDQRLHILIKFIQKSAESEIQDLIQLLIEIIKQQAKVIETQTQDKLNQINILMLTLSILCQLGSINQMTVNQPQWCNFNISSKYLYTQSEKLPFNRNIQKVLSDNIESIGNIVFASIRRLLQIQTDFNLNQQVEEGFQIMLEEMISTIYSRRRENSTNIPQYIYDQQQVMFKDFNQEMVDKNPLIRQIRQTFLQFIETLQNAEFSSSNNLANCELFAIQKPNNLFSGNNDSIHELQALIKTMQLTSYQQFIDSCRDQQSLVGQYVSNIKKYYTAVVSTTAFVKFDSQDQFYSTLSLSIMSRYFYNKQFSANQNAKVHQNQIVIYSEKISQECLSNSLQLINKARNCARNYLVLPHADLVLSTECGSFMVPEMIYRYNALNAQTIQTFSSQYIFGVIGNMSRFAQKVVLLDSKLLQKCFQSINNMKQKQQLDQVQTTSEQNRTYILKLIYILCKNNTQILNMFKSLQIQFGNEKLSFVSILMIQCLCFVIPFEETEAQLVLITLFLKQGLQELTVDEQKMSLKPNYLQNQLLLKLQLQLTPFKYSYRWNSNWVDDAQFQTQTGTIIMTNRENGQNKYFSLMVDYALCLPQVDCQDAIQTQLDSYVTEAPKITQLHDAGQQNGYLDNILQLMNCHNTSVTMLNKLTSIALLQFENKKSRQKQSCFKARHNDLMMLECACEGCVSCLQALNGVEYVQEVKQTQLPHHKNLLTYKGVASYTQLLLKLLLEERLDSLILQEVLSLLNQVLEQSFLEQNFLRYGQELCEQVIVQILQLICKIGNQTQNLTLFIAACVEYGSVRNILCLIQYLSKSVSIALSFSVLSFLLSVESPLSQVFAHQFVQFGGLSSSFFNYIVSKQFLNQKTCAVHYALHTLSIVAQTSPIYELKIIKDTPNNFFEIFSEFKNELIINQLFRLGTSLNRSGPTCYEKLQNVFMRAILAVKTNPKGVSKGCLELIHSCILHSRIYYAAVLELVNVFKAIIKNMYVKNEIKEKVINIINQLKLLGADINIQEEIVQICQNEITDGIKEAIKLMIARAEFEGDKWALVRKKAGAV
ncbi:Kinase [Hexamita inflata]|uniref:non-specific serine/threonine protein kinase n=1 Tax=Hexamita inflata TaxID=28002 RepID=A0AA86PVV5_9EUKA|nr:Kinase [Hexamita inflata]